MTSIDFTSFLINVSTYKPFDLDSTYESILEEFVENESASVYQVFKGLTETSPGLIKSGLDYKNVHMRVKRLVELKQIEQLKKHFERGAIHYKITTHGLISYLSQTKHDINLKIFRIHNDNVLIKDLIYQFLEEKTIDSLEYLEPPFFMPTNLISDYIRNCCRATFEISCWSYFNDPNLEDILPPEGIIQDYFEYVNDKSITVKQPIIKELKEYEMKFEAKTDDPDLMYLLSESGDYSKRYSGYHYNFVFWPRELDDEDFIKAPFPILDMYRFIMYGLREVLKIKIKTLALQVILSIGELCDLGPYKDKETGELDENLDGNPYMVLEHETGGRTEQIDTILQDKKFKSLVDSTQGKYRIGLESFTKGEAVVMEEPA